MSEKRHHILEVAIRLFARKGYHATSIQEIVDELGIAKGSLYFHFKSKEDLLISIYNYYIDLIYNQMTELNEEGSYSPRERVELLIVQHFKFISEHRDFIKMQMQDKVVVSKEIQNVLLELRSRTLQWRMEQILEIYGAEMKPYAYDGAALLGSMMGEFLSYVIFDEKKFDYHQLASFIADRLDDIMFGMQAKGKQPLLDESILQGKLCTPQVLEKREQVMLGIIREMKALITEWEIESETGHLEQNEVRSSLSVLEEELQKEEPQMILVKGMLAYLKELDIPGLEQHIKQLQKLV